MHGPDGNLGETTNTSFETFLKPGNYDIYVAAYDSQGDLIITTKTKSIQIADVDVKFKDKKFETWMIARGLDTNEDNKIQLTELPTVLDIGLLTGQEEYTELPFDDCTISYPENIYSIKEIRINNAGYIKANIFESMKNITSIESFSIAEVTGIDNFNKLLSYFPHLKKINIGWKRVNYNTIETLIEDCSFLNNYTGLTSLSMFIEPSKIDWDHIIKHKDTLEQFSLDGNGKDYSKIELTKWGELVNLKETGISNVKLKNGVFINNLQKLKELNLNEVDFDEAFVLSNSSINQINYSSGAGKYEGINKVIFGDVSGVEDLRLGGNYWYGPASSIDLNSNQIENMKNLKYLQIQNFQMLHDLSFLEKLSNLEWIDLYAVAGATNFPNLDNHNKLRAITYTEGTLSDISNLEGLVKKKSFKELRIAKQYDLNPNKRKNQKIIDLLEDRKKKDKEIVCDVEGYHLKDYVNDIANAVGEIETISMGTIKTFSPLEVKIIEELITEENFPILESYDVKVVNQSGIEKNPKENLGSKDKIQIINTLGNIVQEYTAIIYGDVTGNGEVKLYDSFKILNDSVKKNTIDEIDIEIRDYNKDGKVATYDALQYLKNTMKE